MNILGWSFFRDACIINLSHKYESSFKSPFYLFLTIDLVFQKPFFFFFTLYKTYLIFLDKILLFTLYQKKKSDFFTNQVLFILIHKTYLIFLDKILILHFTKTGFIYLFFFTNQVLFILIHKINLIFLLKEDIIHKANLFELFFVKCLSCVFNISFNIM